jgi:hypothetical protein
METELNINGKIYILKEEAEDSKNNTGQDNSGYWNSGHWNSGNRNSGYWNSGNRNSGYWNSGNGNSGDRNSGYWNSGNRNSGHRNSGHWNSGHWNSGDRNSGYFNIDEPKIRIFGKETEVKIEDINFPSYLYFNLTEWIIYENITDEEKKSYPFAKWTKGYLRTYEYKKAFKNSFKKASKEDVKLTLELPNFDYEIFEDISGISKADFEKKLK